MDDINSLEQSFKESKEYNDASFKVIVALQKKIAELESQNESLKSMLEKNVPMIQNDVNTLGISNELLICETQIALLRQKAMSAELTKEECQKFEIYFNILQKYKDKPNKNKNAEYIPDEELLNIVQINGNK